ncbi:hypothetical protein B0H19DRAFT_1004445, partial [Mycena capillaripes]
MHWACLNFTELLIGLFRGTLDCEKPDNKKLWAFAVLQGAVWKLHGKSVADATPYLPGSFDRPPRNPAEKISSGYKAWEFLLYLVGLAPALLHGTIPDAEWKHLCKGVSVIRCFNQYKIAADQIVRCHKLAIDFVGEFEALYYQGMPERIHFVRQSVHVMSHLAPETIRLGPAPLYSQWTIERTIGNLGQEIKSQSEPYANLGERALLRCQLNALKAMVPGFDPEEKKLPNRSIVLGDSFVLLHARDDYRHNLHGAHGRVIRGYMEAHNGPMVGNLGVVRWARLRLPNGQIARSLWREAHRPLNKLRIARNILFDGKHQIAEVHFYFRAEIQGTVQTLALVDLYSEPDEEFAHESYNTVIICGHGKGEHLAVIPAKSILSVVAMVPLSIIPGSNERYRTPETDYFLVEKPGLELMELAGYEEE